MPDLMSHLVIGLILAEIFNIRKKSLVALGAIMPDLIAKIDLLVFHLNAGIPLSFVHFHTPVMGFLAAIFLARFFRYSQVKASLFIILGVMSHLAADLAIKHFSGSGGVYLLFPFSVKPYSLGLIWPEQSFYTLILSVLVYAFVKIVKRNYSKSH